MDGHTIRRNTPLVQANQSHFRYCRALVLTSHLSSIVANIQTFKLFAYMWSNFALTNAQQ